MDSLKAKKVEQQKEFVRIYKQKVFPFLKGHEVLRKRLFLKTNLIVIAPISGILIVYFLFKVSHFDYAENLVAALWLYCIMLAVLVFALYYKQNQSKKFAVNLKKNCIVPITKAFEDLKWSNNERIISDTELLRSELFADFNIRYIDDEFKGSYQDIEFKVCETKLIKQSGSSKYRSRIKVFEGIVLHFKTNKSVVCHTMVSTKGDLTSRNNQLIAFLGILAAFADPAIRLFLAREYFTLIISVTVALIVLASLYILDKYFSGNGKKMNKIILEDVKFGKKYHVYSYDEVEARCIVTPAFMEKFLNLSTAFGSKNAKCAFYNNNVMIAITTNKDLFEVGKLNKSLLDPDSFKKLYKEISAIYEIIDYFKLRK